MNRKVLLYLVIPVLIIVSCKSDDTSTEPYVLDGNWQISEAFRNNEPTTTLQDGYFKFIDSTMETNILGDPISGVYRLDDRRFVHKSSLPATYNITQYTLDSMQLTTEIRGFRFKFKLNKSLDSILSN